MQGRMKMSKVNQIAKSLKKNKGKKSESLKSGSKAVKAPVVEQPIEPKIEIHTTKPEDKRNVKKRRKKQARVNNEKRGKIPDTGRGKIESPPVSEQRRKKGGILDKLFPEWW